VHPPGKATVQFLRKFLLGGGDLDGGVLACVLRATSKKGRQLPPIENHGYVYAESGTGGPQSEIISSAGVTVVLKFLKFLKFQNCPEIVLKLQIVLKF